MCQQGLRGTGAAAAGGAVAELEDTRVTRRWHRCSSALMARLAGTSESQPEFLICLLRARFQR